MKAVSTYYTDFYVAGTRYWDAPLVINKMNVGDTIKIIPEPNNPKDPNAIALYWKKKKIGYIPRSMNELPAQLFRFGYKKVFKCIVLKIDKNANTWNQIQVGLYFRNKKDAHPHQYRDLHKELDQV